MKQFDVTQERELNGHTFYVRPFGAWKASNLSGELVSLLVPAIGSLAPLLGGDNKGRKDDTADTDEIDIMAVDATVAAPAIAKALSGFDGDRVETLLKKMLVKHKNISVQRAGEDSAEILTEDLADELFCGEVQDMFVLAADVIKANFNGFFKRLGGQFGDLLKGLLEKV